MYGFYVLPCSVSPLSSLKNAGFNCQHLVLKKYHYYLTSGSPVTDVNTDTMPASTAVDTVSVQSTPPNAVAAPMPPIAACAVVFTARMPAAFNHFLFFSFNIIFLLIILNVWL